MAAPGWTTALRAETFDNLQLNAGIMIKNFDYSAVANAGALKTLIAGIVGGTVTNKGEILGATRGGGTFTVTRESRTPQIDGMRYGFIGSDFIDSTDAYLSTTFVEVTAENITTLLGSGKATTPSGSKITTIKMNTALADDDYLDNVTWVGDLADGKFVLICLQNAINTADFTLTYTDKGEGTLAAEFHARQEAVDDYDEAPFEVLIIDVAST